MWQTGQFGDVKRGSGTFERVEAIQYDGSLHLSFYDMTTGQSMGGVYFGTQQQVDYSKAWHPGTSRLVFPSQSAERMRDHSVPAQRNVQPAKRPNPDPEVSDVKIVTGRNQFAEGDEIVIDKVMCSSGEFKAGDKVVVQGHYKLASIPEARLALSLTTSANGGRGRWQAEQYGDVKRGSGTFERAEFIEYDGSLHLSFYDMTTGKSIGGVYFGTQKQVDPSTSWYPGSIHAPSSEVAVAEIQTVQVIGLIRPGDKRVPEWMAKHWQPKSGLNFLILTKDWVLGNGPKRGSEDFVLVAPGHPDVRTRLTLLTMGVRKGDGFKAYEAEVVPEDGAKIAPGVGYSIKPINTSETYRWQVANDLEPVSFQD